MQEPLEKSFESTLYRLLANYQKGDQSAIAPICRLLTAKINRPVPDGALPALQEMLKIPESQFQVAASVALASMKERAAPALPLLQDLAIKDFGDPGNSAICALAAIPGQRSVEALLKALESCLAKNDEFGHQKAWFVMENCKIRPRDFTAYLPRIETLAKKIFVDQPDMFELLLQPLRFEAREEATAGLEEMVMPGHVDLLFAKRSFLAGNFEDVFIPQELPNGSGIIVNERFPYTGRRISEIGLQIHRHPTHPNKYLILLSEDGQAFGDPLSNAIEDVATAIRETYSLGTADVTWIHHTSPESGLTLREKDEFDRVVFAPLDPRTRWFKNPSWLMIRSFPAFLENWNES